MRSQVKISNGFDGETAIKRLRAKKLCKLDIITSVLALTKDVVHTLSFELIVIGK